MKKTLLPLSCLLLPVLLHAQWKQLADFLPTLIQEADIPGLSIAVLDQGEVAYVGAFGVRSQDTREPIDEQTVFDAASLSKPLFAYGVMQLVEEGKFDLDQPLYKYLPYPDAASDDRYKAITGRMVLSHTTGFPNWRRGDLKILFKPGAHYSYSGEGFVYLMKVIEKVTGKSLDDWVSGLMFNPLEMDRSSYVWQEKFEDNYAFPHGTIKQTFKKRKPKAGNTAYSLQTTAKDYARFLQAVMNHEGLQKTTTQKMLTRQIRASERNWRSGPLSESIGWALGWGTEQTERSQYFWQWGDNGPFKGFVMFDPASQKGVVYFANSSHGLTIAPAICERVFGEKHPVFSWLNYGTYNKPVNQLEKKILAEGFAKAIPPFLDKNGKHQDTLQISERDMNALGYRFVSRRRYEDAKQVLGLNMLAFPSSANAYDSYGEICLRTGDRESAATYYAKAAAIDTSNKQAKDVARQLTKPTKGNTTFTLEAYSNAKLVSVAGDFNGWKELGNLMQRRNGVWVTSIDLDPGKYEYKFVVDGVWIIDPANPAHVYEGNHHSVIEVK
ncbi:MAG: serine hydrolase [Saprospiraceae bacterium]|nr:serine hydrolase [Saprospiraceae bacterium]